MFKLLSSLAAVALTVLPLVPAGAGLGPDAARCDAGKEHPAFLVNVSGFKNRNGRLRVQVYGSNPADFLARGKGLRRIDLPVTSSSMGICVAVPRPGTYAIAVRHDTDGNGRSGWNDGGGFSRNPKISLARLKPRHREVAVAVGEGVKPVEVVLNYRKGLSIGPVGR
ncbi:DUF2141 domain-containing protein [Sphingosinicella rhizophila]|uniref:DUF2141 domain-containing protein n=1 Tax=Sphingosinicella rhizophila TaxID=3050082 RepID=A0ABU3Q582_9SPHN|nr:DUF2141 domain-containing protein [Sphingosinicella sp. GR2756]MDT9598569.1 DUF2141 domain-containing protein [Sphingosinicella sp. GR2756]